MTLFVIFLFVLGSGLCGGANNVAMLIAGRAIQGMGGGGLNTLPNIIVSDLVPLRERGKYVACFLTTYFIGIAIGPWVGGAIVDHTTWRWVFYINLPVSSLYNRCRIVRKVLIYADWWRIHGHGPALPPSSV